MSKLDRLKKRNRERKDKPVIVEAPRPDPVYTQTVDAIDNRPTPERYARGSWIEPTGKDAADHVLIDRDCDMIGRLYRQNALTYAQFEAARSFQAILAAFQAELGVSGYRSCLADNAGGYEGSDGNPAVFAMYDAVKRRLGAVRFVFLRTECDKPAERHPGNLAALRVALDAFSGEKRT
jgi:hypothetical protein